MSAEFFYIYDGDGNIIRSIDITAEKEYTYIYEDGRILCATEYDIALTGELITGRTLVNRVQYTYNSEGNLTNKTVISADNSTFSYSYTTNDSGQVSETFTAGGKTVTSYSTTDSFGRKTVDELKLGSGSEWAFKSR